jgi:hypothetical protein
MSHDLTLRATLPVPATFASQLASASGEGRQGSRHCANTRPVLRSTLPCCFAEAQQLAVDCLTRAV